MWEAVVVVTVVAVVNVAHEDFAAALASWTAACWAAWPAFVV